MSIRLQNFRKMKQTIKITFWSPDEETAQEAVDFVYEKHIDKGTDEELEFEGFDTKAYKDGGGECTVTYTHIALCEYYPGSYWEPDDYDYSAFIDEDDPVEWFNEFNTEEEPERVLEITCLETIDDIDDGSDYDDYDWDEEE